MSLKHNFGWLLASKVTVMTALFITGALINRSLGTAGRGVFAEMQTWVALFSTLLGMSIDVPIYHFSNWERYGSDDRSRFVTVMVLSAGYALLAALFMTLFTIFLPEQVSRETGALIILLDALLIGTMLATNLTVLLQALENIRLAALVGIVQAGVSLTLIVPAYLSGHLTLTYALGALTLVQVVTLCIIVAQLLKTAKGSGTYSKVMASGMVRAGLKQHLATIFTFVYIKVNQIIVFRYSGESEAGIFAVALNLAFALMFIPATFQTALYPRVIRSSDDYEITVRSMRVGFYAWGVMAIIIILSAEPLLLLYGGSDFRQSVTIFRILMVAAWLLPLSSLLAPYYVKMGAFGVASASAVALGSISVVLNFVMVPLYASTGAALATALTCLTGFCMGLGLLRYLSGENPFVIFRPDFRRELSFLSNKD